MVVVKQLSAKLQIKLVVKFADSFPDMGRLGIQVLFVVKSYYALSQSLYYYIWWFIFTYYEV